MNAVETAKILAAVNEMIRSRVSKAVSETRDQIVSELMPEIQQTQSAITEQINGIEILEGPRGGVGEIGPQGLKGDRGDVGEHGPQGKPGERGLKGDVGLQGPQGESGEKGDVGPRGAKSDRGIQGRDGPVGPKGDDGAPGRDGRDGVDGAAGPQGLRGEKGEKGDKGDVGPQGKTGAKGLKGDRGDDGAAGPQGPQGPQGKKGNKGDSGDTPDVAPIIKTIDDKFNRLTEAVDKRVSRIAFSKAGGDVSGSGEVKLYRLDDVDYKSVKTPTNGQSLVYNSSLGKWQANTVSGGGGTLSNTFSTTVETQALIPAANNVYDLGSSARRYRTLYLTSATLILGDIQLKAADGTLQVTPAPTAANPNPDPVPIGTGVNAADYGLITNAVSSTQDYGAL